MLPFYWMLGLLFWSCDLHVCDSGTSIYWYSEIVFKTLFPSSKRRLTPPKKAMSLADHIISSLLSEEEGPISKSPKFYVFEGRGIAQPVSRRLGQKWRWGRFSPRTSVSPANLHSICFSTSIFTITRGWHNSPKVAALPIASQTKIKNNTFLTPWVTRSVLGARSRNLLYRWEGNKADIIHQNTQRHAIVWSVSCQHINMTASFLVLVYLSPT
jgi:hypothetical protein